MNSIFNSLFSFLRPQPPALPRERGGGDPLPDGGCDSRHDVAEDMACGPRSGAFLNGDSGCTIHQSHPQPKYHWHFQCPAAVEALPQLETAHDSL